MELNKIFRNVDNRPRNRWLNVGNVLVYQNRWIRWLDFSQNIKPFDSLSKNITLSASLCTPFYSVTNSLHFLTVTWYQVVRNYERRISSFCNVRKGGSTNVWFAHLLPGYLSERAREPMSVSTSPCRRRLLHGDPKIKVPVDPVTWTTSGRTQRKPNRERPSKIIHNLGKL